MSLNGMISSCMHAILTHACALGDLRPFCVTAPRRGRDGTMASMDVRRSSARVSFQHHHTPAHKPAEGTRGGPTTSTLAVQVELVTTLSIRNHEYDAKTATQWGAERLPRARAARGHAAHPRRAKLGAAPAALVGRRLSTASGVDASHTDI